MTIITVLSSISLPVYLEHKKNTRRTANKTELAYVHKAWQAFGIKDRNYCYNNKSGLSANLVSVGLESVLYSKGKYGSESRFKPNFIGFQSVSSSSCKAGNDAGEVDIVNGVGSTDSENKKAIGVGSDASGSADGDPECRLGNSRYKAGVFANIGGNTWEGRSVGDNGVFSKPKEFKNPPIPIRIDAGCDTL